MYIYYIRCKRKDVKEFLRLCETLEIFSLKDESSDFCVTPSVGFAVDYVWEIQDESFQNTGYVHVNLASQVDIVKMCKMRLGSEEPFKRFLLCDESGNVFAPKTPFRIFAA